MSVLLALSRVFARVIMQAKHDYWLQDNISVLECRFCVYVNHVHDCGLSFRRNSLQTYKLCSSPPRLCLRTNHKHIHSGLQSIFNEGGRPETRLQLTVALIPLCNTNVSIPLWTTKNKVNTCISNTLSYLQSVG